MTLSNDIEFHYHHLFWQKCEEYVEKYLRKMKQLAFALLLSIMEGGAGVKFLRTVVIPCAGMGSRLGFGIPKALLEIEGKPLIIRQLEMLDAEDDIRVVVGYQAEKIMEIVRKYRRDVSFVFNYDYKSVGAGASVALGTYGAGEYVLMLVGDILVHPDDMKMILGCHEEFVCGGTVSTDDPWLLQTYQSGGKELVRTFSKDAGNYEWSGIAQIKSEKIQMGTGYAFQLIEPHLPMGFIKIRTREIDTIHDYERAAEWVRNHFQETESV